MNRSRIEALLLAMAVSTALQGIPLTVLATSVTDFEQQAEDAVNQSVMKGAEAEENGSNEDDTTEADDSEANGVDISQVAPETYVNVDIRDMKDFLSFVEKCHVDSWSRDKSVTLKCDLDFGYQDFPIIETFGGIFNGGGHTIRNVSMTGDEAETGLFGTVQNTGVIRDLNLQGILAPNDDQNKLGGIAGYNYGWIENCSFDGRIVADSQLGGIVGRNGITGTVTNCTATGSITGKAACGGIVGYNEGTINGCTNNMSVNTSFKDTSVTVDQLQRIVDKILKSGNILNAENLEMNSDTGGIAGFSSGVITSCVNKADIGYEHVGYNVGGIAGRSSGYMANNTNHAKIRGRKDVGGIVGQMQPYLAVDFAEDTLNKLDEQLDDLNGLVNTGLNNADAYSDNTTQHLTNINGLTKIAEDATKGLADEGSRQYDEAVNKLNNATAAVQSSISTFSDVADKLSDYAKRVADKTAYLSDSMSEYLSRVDMSDEDQAKMDAYMSDYEKASERMSEDVERLQDDLAGPTVDQAKYEAIQKDLNAIGQDYQDMRTAMNGMENVLKDNGATSDDEAYVMLQAASTALNSERILDDIKTAQSAMDDEELRTGDLMNVLRDSDEMKAGLERIFGDDKEYWNGNKTEDEVRTKYTSELSSDEADRFMDAYKNYMAAYNGYVAATEDLRTIYNKTEGVPIAWEDGGNISLSKDVENDLGNMMNDLGDMYAAMHDMAPIVQHYAGEALDTGSMPDALKEMQKVLKDYPGVSGELTGAMNTLASVDVRMNGVSELMRNHGNNLYSAMEQLSGEMQALNDAVANESDAGVDNLRQITAQFDTILRTLEDAAREIRDPSNETKLQDDSDSDIQNTFQGRATTNTNNGSVQADTNVGGITGMIGVEYDLNPETDIQQTGNTSLNYIFRAKCVVDNSTNYGTISAKNSYGGGIAGHMEMGLVTSSVNYGFLDCEGKYVGGIAGYSVGLVRNNLAKCDVEGTNYVGGITGYGVSLRHNLAMVNATDYTQYVGAIAGKVKNVNKNDVTENYYYSNAIYGIDNVSYQGIAEGISYQDLQEKAEEYNVGTKTQQVLSALQLTFMADDLVVKTITCDYGDSIRDADIPEVPGKDGFHGTWSRTDFTSIREDEVIHAEYSRINTLLVSGQKRTAGKPTIEVAGNFVTGDTLILTEMAPQSGERERWMVTIPDDGLEEHEIRYLVPDDLDRKDAQIFLIHDGKKERVTTGTNGQYLTFEATGNDVAFTVEGGKGLRDLLIKVGIGAGAAAAAGGIGFVALQKARRRKRRAARKHEKRGQDEA